MMSWWKAIGDAIVTVAAILNVSTDEVCFKSEGIGCFSNAKPFDNAAGKLPQSPTEIPVSFLLYTRQNRVTSQTLRTTRAALITSYLDGRRPTKFIIHGFRDHGREGWVNNMTKAILDKDDVNVIVVDWEKGADGRLYSQAAANTRVTGALIANLIKALVLHNNVNVTDVHLIGHSLGAHVAGYAGSRIPGIGRITGLDPAGLHFDDQDIRVRLDPKDALYVDVIHTDGEPITTLGFGSSVSMGDADFYPNGGKNQPGCKGASKYLTKILTGKFKEFTKGVACSHSLVKNLYIESISGPCVFKAYPCHSFADFQAGKCPCDGKCVAMGYQSDNDNPRGNFYLSTNSKPPYCKGT